MSDMPTAWACIVLALLAAVIMIPVCIEIRRRLDDLSTRVQSLVAQK